MQNEITVCVDKKEGMDVAGRIYHRSLNQPQVFLDTSQLLLKTEEIFDAVKYPAAAVEHRVFGKPQKIRAGKKDKAMEEAIKKQAPGKKATFVVQVQYRQNATWQGQVVWSERNETRNFRSALELIRLIDHATEANE
ncbi:hypothetical protein [Christensenella timonensis]|uniref:hypothetical protein n=1 Tax=Christensenella timonensis TaxID=1816678 RepID=UPI000AD975F4|nr:hypothetical protein [Christensenella timonensis]